MTPTLEIRTRLDLNALRDPTARVGVHRVILSFSLDPLVRARAERRLNANLHPCGCAWGAVALGIVIVAWTARLVVGGVPTLTFGGSAIFSLVFVGLAKVLGQFVEDRTLSRTLDQLLDAIPPN